MNTQQCDELATKIKDAADSMSSVLRPFNDAVAAAQTLSSLFRQAATFSVEMIRQKGELDILVRELNQRRAERDNLLVQMEGVIKHLEEGKQFLEVHKGDQLDQMVSKMKVISGGRK